MAGEAWAHRLWGVYAGWDQDAAGDAGHFVGGVVEGALVALYWAVCAISRSVEVFL